MPASLAILGGGASGALVATQLLRLARRPLLVALVERGGGLARGVAYGTRWASHLLNVPAGRMSALPDDPAHFVRWLERERPEVGLGELDFAPRALYGEYLEATLRQAQSAAQPGVVLEALDDEVIRLDPWVGGVAVDLRRGASRRVSGVALAPGNASPEDPPQVSAAVRASGRWRSDPWAPHAFEGIQGGEPVLLLGSGLTAVDAVLALEESGHRGPITALSRRGLLPLGHRRGSASQPWEPPAACWPITARGWLRAFRERAGREAAGESGDWRSAVDGARAITARIWTSLPINERRRFQRHLQAYWDVHRHRMAPQIAARLAALRGSGRLELVAGRLRDLRVWPDGLEVGWSRRGSGASEVQRFGCAINCTGPSFAHGWAADPWLADLLARGHACLDPLGLGLRCSPEGEVFASSGMPSSRLLTLGPPLKGTLWETVAIPEIRSQADHVARRLLALAEADDRTG